MIDKDIEESQKIDKYQKKKQSISGKKQLSKKPEVDEIVKLQAVDGSWNDSTLIDRLAKNAQQVHELATSTHSAVLITKLVVLWLQKHHPQKQYSLIIKKALAWLKKTQTEKEITEEKLATIESI